MNILIGGAGKVGYNLAKALSTNHNVIIVDTNKKALDSIKETLDVMTVSGDIREAHTFLNIEEEIDFYLAVTNNDEINLISTLVIRDILEVKNVIVRLSNTSYMAVNLQNKLNINKLVFPYKVSAEAVSKLLEFPKANNIKEFPFTDYVLVSVTVKNPEITKVKEIEENDIKVIGAEKNGEFVFLNEEDEIKNGDLLYVFGNRGKIKHYLNLLDTVSPFEIKNILIFEANPLGIEIAKILSNFEINIKILEKDEKLAKKAADLLGEEVNIINSSYEDEEMLLNEGIQYSDIAIAASLKDETNIIKSLQARKLGIKKIITINNNLNYYSLMHSLRLSTIRGPKIAAFYEILEVIDSQFLIYERFFLGAKGKIFIKEIFTQKSVTPPKEKVKILILRKNNIYVVKETFEVKEGDIVMEFNFSGNKKWIETL